ALSINGSLENTNGYVEYAYLPYRADFTAMAFQESQNSAYLSFSRDGSNGVFVNDATDKRYGLGAGARYPFSPFTRVEGGLFARFTERTTVRDIYDSNLVRVGTETERVRVDALLPSAAWVHDN